MQLFELKTDFLRPLWRRVLLVVFCLGWATFEFSTGAVFWGMIFGALGVYSAWQLFFDGWPASSEETLDSDKLSDRESDQ
jgi:hypothetical protein